MKNRKKTHSCALENPRKDRIFNKNQEKGIQLTNANENGSQDISQLHPCVVLTQLT
jgi:hypothetical protein